MGADGSPNFWYKYAPHIGLGVTALAAGGTWAMVRGAKKAKLAGALNTLITGFTLAGGIYAYDKVLGGKTEAERTAHFQALGTGNGAVAQTNQGRVFMRRYQTTQGALPAAASGEIFARDLGAGQPHLIQGVNTDAYGTSY